MNKKDLQNPIREFRSKDGNSPITEANLTKVQLDKREDYLKQLKKNKKELVKRYGKDAESVMYGRATNLAKKAVSEMDKQKLKELVKTSLMKDEVEENKVYGPGELDFSSFITPEQKIVAKAFMVDPTKTKMDYENNTVIFPDPIRIELAKGGETMLGSVKMGNRLGFVKGYFDEDGNEIEGAYIKMPYKYPMGEGKKEDMDKDGDIDSKDYLAKRDIAIKKAKGEMKEDIDLGHEDNEPHMIKGDLYRIGKYAMELYAIVEELEETGQEIDFPAWWQAMITDSKEQMVKSKHYLDFELKEPAIDAAVDALTGEAPHMGEPKSPMMEAEIGKDEILAGKIMKALKDMANKDASDQHNLKQARTALNKGNMSAAEKIAKPYLSEKIAKKLTKDKLKEMIKNSINEGDIDEGFFDRLKSNIKGITAKTSTTFDNLKAFAKGDKDAIKDPKLAQNVAKLQQKTRTLDKELADAMKDMATLFPKDVLVKTPEAFQTVLNQYVGLLDQVKNINNKIGSGNLDFTKSTTPKPTVAPTTAAAPTTPKPTVAPTTAAAPTTPKPTDKQKIYNYKGKNYPLQTDKDGSYVQVGGTKITVQPKFDPNKGATTTPTTTPTTPPTTKLTTTPKDEKGRFVSQLKEYTYDDFSGSKLIANTPIPTDINIFKKFFPTGVASIGNAKASLQASDNSGIKDRMGRYAPMFAHVQYHEFEDQTGEKYRAHQTQYYNSNFDKQDPNFDPSVTDLTLFKLASPDGLSKDTNIGSILVKTDAYIKDLDKLNISKKSM